MVDISLASEHDLKSELIKRDNQRLASIPKGSIVHPKMKLNDAYRNLLKYRHWNEYRAFNLHDMKLWACVKETNRGSFVEFSGLHIKYKNEEFIKHPIECHFCDLLLEDIIKYNGME